MDDRWSRQSFLGPESHKILTESTIGIVGLCGGGSHIAQQTAHTGFHNFIIADYDHVEPPNLNRMVGSQPEDAKNKILKTKIIDHLIKKINPDANVTTISEKWQLEERSLRCCSVIVGCVDSFSARDELERFCRRYLIPYIDIGMDVHKVANGFSISGQVITSLPNSPCMRCIGYLTDARLKEEQQRYGEAGEHPQVIWPNGVLASIAVGQLMTILLPWNTELTPSILIEYDGNRQITRESPKTPIFLKQHCNHFKTADGLGDPFFSL